MSLPSKHSRLDLLHKGIFPAAAIIVGLFSVLFTVYCYLSNGDKQRQLDDKQRQLDTIQAKLQTMEEQRQIAESRQRTAIQQTENSMHEMRVELCKWLVPAENASDRGTNEQDRHRYARVKAAFLIADLKQKDAERVGDEAAKEMWQKAEQEAERKTKPKKLDWFI